MTSDELVAATKNQASEFEFSSSEPSLKIKLFMV